MTRFANVFATPSPLYASRRDFLRQTGSGFGLLALAGLSEAAELRDFSKVSIPPAPRIDPLNPMAPRAPHFEAKAKSVIWLFMNGGPSQVDTWDYKPELTRRSGQELAGFDQKTGFFAGAAGPLMGSPFRFERRGESGTWVPEIFPMLGRHVDDMAFIHSCFTETNNHSPALFEMNTGFSRMGFPGVGSWVTYGLGSESRNLPGFVVMYDTKGRGLPKGNASNWGAGFLPGVFQGTALNPQGLPIDNLERLPALTDSRQRAQLDLLRRMNQRGQSLNPAEAALSARIESFELAYRMQMTAPEAIDIARESGCSNQL